MKFSSGKRIGQSEQQLSTAVLFSFFLHALLFLTALFLHFAVMPRISVPPFYSVKLVGMPSEPSGPVQAPPSQAPPAAPKHQAKPAAPAKPKAKKGAEKTHRAAQKESLPDLSASAAKKKPAAVEQEKPSEPPTAARSSATPSAQAGAKNESVSPVVATQSDFKFGWYLDRVRSKIGQNWNPPPDARDAKVRVVFSVNRSGWVGEVKVIEKDSVGRFEFQRAGVRAIHASNPFPPLPEEFSRQTLEFSVDLMAVE